MQTEKQWLTSLKTNGVELALPELIRYQELTRLMDLKPKFRPQSGLSGAYLSRQKGRGMEFDEARHYQPGDDIRAIDWRVTARTGKTHTKIYREERERPVFILCDLSRSMQFGTRLLLKSVQAAHLASLIGWSAASRGDKVGALIFNDTAHRECKPLSRKRAVLNICNQLIHIQHQSSGPSNTEAFSQACMRLRRLARPGSLVYLLSDFQTINHEAEQQISGLSRHCEVRAVRITDPLETELPQVSNVQPVSVTNGSESQIWLLGDSKQQQQYLAWRQEATEKLLHHLQSARVNYSHFSAGSPLDIQFQAHTGGRG